MNCLKRWKLAWLIIIILLGFLIHFIFSWTGESVFAGLFVPVNESVWEHLKLGYWPVVLYSLVEYFQVKHLVNNYFLAKLTGILALEFTIVAVFYSYTFILGRNVLWADISLYVAAVVICQHITYKIQAYKPLPKLPDKLSLLAITGIGMYFAVATFYPPHLGIFKETKSNTYGIHKEK